MLDVCGTGGKLLPVNPRIKTRVHIGIKLLALLAAVCGATSCSVQIRKLTVAQSGSTFAQNWPFTALTEADYTIGSNVELSGGVSRLAAASHADTTSGNFTSGSMNGVTYDSGTSALLLDHSGTPTNVADLDESWTPQWSSIRGYWKLNNDVTDSKGTNNGTENGTFTYTNGKIGTKAASFNGTNTYVSIPDAPALRITGQLTLSAWIKLNVPTANIWYRILSKKTAWNAANGYELAINPAAKSLELSGGNGNWGGSVGVIVPDSNWHYFAATINGTSVKAYWDGVDVTTISTGDAVAADTTPFAIGSLGNSASYLFNGQIDDVAVWSTELTPAEVGLIYSRQSAKYSGTFASRVMDALATAQSWTSLAWVSRLPFMKELPDYSGGIQNETSTDYTSLVGSTGATGANDLMNDVVALWHLNESLGTSGASSVVDDSGKGAHGTPTSTTFGGAGRLGTAAKFNQLGYVSATVPDVTTTAGEYNSVSFWMKWDGNYENGWADVLAFDSVYTLTIESGQGGKLGYNTAVGDNWGIAYPGLGGQWVHIVAEFYNGAIANSKIYINGELQTLTLSGPASTKSAVTGFTFGKTAGFTDGRFSGYLDEIAIWNRALTDAEVLQLYRRGANRVKHQVRVCTAADCSDDAVGANWKGPDGTRYSYFSELNNNTVALTAAGNVKPGLPTLTFSDFTAPVGTSQYFQYRTILESDDAGTGCDYGSGATWCSPDLKSATIAPTHYDNSSPSIVGKTGVAYSSLSTFTETLGASCGSGVTYNLGVGSSAASAAWYYWSGAAWTAANGTAAQSNAANVINTNASSFGTAVGTGTVYFKAYLGSSGTTACELDNVSLGGVF
jgi:trimeric autotransporter adhesin